MIMDASIGYVSKRAFTVPGAPAPPAADAPLGDEVLSEMITTLFESYTTMAPALDELERRTISFDLRFAEYLRSVERHATAIMFVDSALKILERHRKVS